MARYQESFDAALAGARPVAAPHPLLDPSRADREAARLTALAADDPEAVLAELRSCGPELLPELPASVFGGGDPEAVWAPASPVHVAAGRMAAGNATPAQEVIVAVADAHWPPVRWPRAESCLQLSAAHPHLRTSAARAAEMHRAQRAVVIEHVTLVLLSQNGLDRERWLAPSQLPTEALGLLLAEAFLADPDGTLGRVLGERQHQELMSACPLLVLRLQRLGSWFAAEAFRSMWWDALYQDDDGKPAANRPATDQDLADAREELVAWLRSVDDEH